MQFGVIVEDVAAYFMVLTLGIVHGANDLLILKKNERFPKRFLKSVIGYVSLIGICLISYFINPFIALLLFILLSSYHFGEEHFEHKIVASRRIQYPIYLVYGLLIFLMIFNENIAEVNLIVSDLTNQTFSKQLLSSALVATIALLITLFVYGFWRKTTFKVNFFKEIFYLCLLYLVFKTTSLILGFAIYFILWHSIPSIIDQTYYISGSITKKSLIHYFKNASLIWLLSIVGLIGIYFYLDQNLFSSVIFIILFAVTAPHTWVMYRMKKK